MAREVEELGRNREEEMQWDVMVGTCEVSGIFNASPSMFSHCYKKMEQGEPSRIAKLSLGHKTVLTFYFRSSQLSHGPVILI